MRILNGVTACLVLFAGTLRAEAQEEKAVKADAKSKGTFITTVGTHKLHDGRVTLKIEEKDGKLDTYVTHSSAEGEKEQGEKTWGPVNPRIKKDANWFIYSESPDEVWWFNGEQRLYVFPHNEHRSKFGRGGISQVGGKYLELAPKEVLDRLPKEFKEKEAAEAKKDAEVNN